MFLSIITIKSIFVAQSRFGWDLGYQIMTIPFWDEYGHMVAVYLTQYFLVTTRREGKCLVFMNQENTWQERNATLITPSVTYINHKTIYFFQNEFHLLFARIYFNLRKKLQEVISVTWGHIITLKRKPAEVRTTIMTLLSDHRLIWTVILGLQI